MKIKINSYAEKAYKFYVKSGMTSAGACGLMGNQYYESDGFVSHRVEYLCLKRLAELGKNYTQDTYYKAVDSGKISKSEFLNPLPGKVYGFGLCQWTTPYPRKAELYQRTVESGKSIADETIQLEYAVYELQNRFPSVWKILTTTDSVKTASDIVLKDFESPNNWQEQSQTRYKIGNQYYSYFNPDVNKTNETAGSKIEMAITWMETMAKDDSHGYSQEYRWGENGDYDCSSAVITAWQQAGIPVKTNGATYTGNIYTVFVKLGFVDVTPSVSISTGSGLLRGDILLNHQKHVAMYCGNNMEVEASINEKGRATGGQPGDQTGKEFLIRPYRNYPWDCVLRYTGETSYGSSGSTLGVLKVGSKGYSVIDLQTNLNNLGYNLVVDGDFGLNTKSAVMDFQNKQNLIVDGEVGTQTKTEIDEQLNKKKQESATAQSYMVKVIVSALNIRTGPGVNYSKCGVIRDQGTYTIIDTNGLWGKLKSGAGWICLEYTTKIQNEK